MSQPKPFRLQGATKKTLTAEWNRITANVHTRNARPQRVELPPLPANATPLQRKWRETELRVAKGLGLYDKPSTTGGIYDEPAPEPEVEE